MVNTDLACGYAEYARELKAELDLEFDSRIVEPGQDVGEAEVVIASYGSAETLRLRPSDTDRWRAEGRKVVLLHRESEGDKTENCTIPVRHFIGHADAIVTHEPTNYGTEFIPISFPEVESLPEPNPGLVIGEAGFYDPMKCFEEAMDVARAAGGSVNFVMTVHRNVDAPRNAAAIDALRRRALAGDSISIVFDSVPNVIRMLARSTVNMFWHQARVPCSQSTSVGMAIAARRPLIISGHRRFLVIQTQYADEVYVAQTKEDAVVAVKGIWDTVRAGKQPRTPKRLYDAFSWRTCGRTYRELVHRLTGR